MCSKRSEVEDNTNKTNRYSRGRRLRWLLVLAIMLLLLLLRQTGLLRSINSNYLQAIRHADEGYDNTNDGHGNEKENETDEDGTGTGIITASYQTSGSSNYSIATTATMKHTNNARSNLTVPPAVVAATSTKGGKKTGYNRGGKGGKKTGYTGNDRGDKGGKKTTATQLPCTNTFGDKEKFKIKKSNGKKTCAKWAEKDKCTSNLKDGGEPVFTVCEKSCDHCGEAPSAAPTDTASGKQFGHFFMHIPKSGGVYAFKTLTRLLFSTPEWKSLSKQQKPFRPCNVVKKSLSNFQEKFRKFQEKIPCTLWMSEQPFSPVPERVYAIVRDPRSHTLSMYFHCLESRNHQKQAHKMPKSLDTWLDAWIAAKNDTTKQLANQKLFACYNPLNFQTRWIGHNFLLKKQNNFNIYYTEDDGNTATANTTGKQQPHTRYIFSDNDLKERYMVLGDNDQMDKSVCMIFIHYTGWVPKRCDCSTARSTTAVKAAVAVNTTDHRFAHGVTHHGSSFQTTPAQDAKIALLRDLDYPLYQTSRTIFREQVRLVEDKYNITICDKLLSK